MDQKEIIGLPVYTESGNYLGQVVGLEIDPRTEQVKNYFIKSHNFLKNLFQGHLIIGAEQVLSVSKEKVVVRDAFKKIRTLPRFARQEP